MGALVWFRSPTRSGLSGRTTLNAKMRAPKAPSVREIILTPAAGRAPARGPLRPRTRVLAPQPQNLLAQPGLGVGEIAFGGARRNIQHRRTLLQTEPREIPLLHPSALRGSCGASASWSRSNSASPLSGAATSNPVPLAPGFSTTAAPRGRVAPLPVHEHRRLERVPRRFPHPLRRRQFAQLAIDKRQDPLRRRRAATGA